MLCWMVGWLLLTIPFAETRADERSEELLQRLEKQIARMGGYRLDFVVEADGAHIPGYYRVEGDCYYLALSGAEVFGDGKSRHEVDPEKREVVIDVTDPASHNILNNPTRIFHLLAQDFTHEVIMDKGDAVRLALHPKSASAGFSRVELELDRTTASPRALLYDADGEQILIRVTSLKRDASPLPIFDAKRYPDYEVIDFR